VVNVGHRVRARGRGFEGCVAGAAKSCPSQLLFTVLHSSQRLAARCCSGSSRVFSSLSFLCSGPARGSQQFALFSLLSSSSIGIHARGTWESIGVQYRQGHPAPYSGARIFDGATVSALRRGGHDYEQMSAVQPWLIWDISRSEREDGG
jgi:hypothetical protein